MLRVSEKIRLLLIQKHMKDIQTLNVVSVFTVFVLHYRSENRMQKNTDIMNKHTQLTNDS